MARARGHCQSQQAMAAFTDSNEFEMRECMRLGCIPVDAVQTERLRMTLGVASSSLNAFLRIFPTLVLGSSVLKYTCLGTLYPESDWRQWSMMSFSVSAGSLRTTNNATTSPERSSGCATAAASRTPGCVTATASTSFG